MFSRKIAKAQARSRLWVILFRAMHPWLRLAATNNVKYTVLSTACSHAFSKRSGWW